MPDPPDGTFLTPVVTTENTTPEQWQAALNAAISKAPAGYPVFAASVPSPTVQGQTWTSVYIKTTPYNSQPAKTKR